MGLSYIPRAAVTSILLGLGLMLSCADSVSSRDHEIKVAVASNFAGALKDLAARFEAGSDYRLALSIGSTGKHFAQITNGAPFDLFFAADTRRPQLLEEQGRIVVGSRFTYAQGKLVLWSPKEDYFPRDGGLLLPADCTRLAIANPRLAPYGKAAEEVMVAQDLSYRSDFSLVRGESIGQTFQFVHSGNAHAGFVAYSQLKRPGVEITGSMWEVPQDLYTPIEQQAVVLTDNPATRSFIEFMGSDDALAVLHDYGYETP